MFSLLLKDLNFLLLFLWWSRQKAIHLVLWGRSSFVCCLANLSSTDDSFYFRFLVVLFDFPGSPAATQQVVFVESWSLILHCTFCDLFILQCKENAHKQAKRNTIKTPLKPRLRISIFQLSPGNRLDRFEESGVASLLRNGQNILFHFLNS